MVKCSKCGVDVPDYFESCPNCGNNLKIEVEEVSSSQENGVKCSKCGSKVKEGLKFCPTCGEKLGLPKQKPKDIMYCPNCGSELDEGGEFCPECGLNIKSGEKNNFVNSSSNTQNSSQKFMEKVDLNLIAKPTIFAIISSLVLSSIGLLIGFSWMSYDIAIILSCIFFASMINNEANAIVFGAITGLFLGLLENPLVEFWYGMFIAGAYEGLFGGQLLFLVILGIVFAYISNIYFKDSILKLINKG